VLETWEKNGILTSGSDGDGNSGFVALFLDLNPFYLNPEGNRSYYLVTFPS